MLQSVKVRRYPTILEMIEEQGRRLDGRTAYHEPGGRTLGFGGLAARTSAFASALAAHGVRRDSRVALVLPNGIDMVVAQLGATIAGISVPLRPDLRPAELSSYFRAIRVSHVVTRPEGGPEGCTVGAAARAVAAEAGVPVLDLAEDGALALPAGTPLPPCPAPAPADCATIMLTSGSTGAPKKVPLTHRNLCASCFETCAGADFMPGDRMLSMFDLNNVGGITEMMLAPLSVGAEVMLVPRFDAAVFYRLLAAWRPTWYQAVPTMLHELVAHARRNGIEPGPHDLRLIRSTAAPLPASLEAEVRALFGVPVIQAYGMTEAGPLLTSSEPDLPPGKQGTVGRSVGPELRILGPDGRALPPGEVGELAARGEGIVSGYEDDPEATAATFRDGWYMTGDAAWLDADGYLFLAGRLKQLINRGGDTVNPQEIDDTLVRHPAVAEAASFPVPHPSLGEDIAAAVTPVRGLTVEAEELRAFAAERLAPYKLPRRFHFVDALPQTPTGKIDRKALAALFAPAPDRPDLSFRDIATLVRRQAAQSPDLPVYEDPAGRVLTRAEVALRVDDIGRLLAAHGVTRDMRVAIVLPNGIDMALSLLGVSVAAVAAPLNPALSRQEFRGYLGTLRAAAVVTTGISDPYSATVRQAACDLEIPVLTVPDGRSAAADARADLPARPAPDDVALVLLTSGSTGRPKKVPLTHRNLCASLANAIAAGDFRRGDRTLSMWELSHIGGMVDMVLAPLAVGGVSLLTPGFDVRDFFRHLAGWRPTLFQAVPTMLHEIDAFATRHPDLVLPVTLRAIRTTAAALSRDLEARVEDRFGIPLCAAYGMTEAAPLLTSMPCPRPPGKLGSVGRTVCEDLAILSPGGKRLGPGEVGEIAARGENIFAGYEDDPEATTEVLREGWYHTGDAGYLDADGYLFLTGRLKQMINRGGETVNPQEIDDVLMAHPEVAQAAAFAIPHRTLGEDIAAAVSLKPGARIGAAELRDHVAGRLAAFKMPRRIVVMDRLPVTATGKVDRLALSSMARAMAESMPQPVSETAAGAAARPAGPAVSLVDRLARIWAEELGLRKVGPDDDFFTIGGDSLSGVRLFLAVEKAFGVPIPERALVHITTVRKMAALLHEAGIEDRHAAAEQAAPVTGLTEIEKRSLVAVMAMGKAPVAHAGSVMKLLNPGGTRTPLFWVFNSPAVEIEWLTPHLEPDRPLYGLYSGGKLFPYSEEMSGRLADFYADEIVRQQPHGPYLLGGSCLGGQVAHFVAERLVARGHEVGKLCLLEYSDPRLGTYEGDLMLAFGSQSRLCAYRPIRWRSRGWDKAFRRRPVVEWVPGTRGRHFRPYNVPVLAEKMQRFLRGEPQADGPLKRLGDAAVMTLHRIPGVFHLYLAIYRARDRIIFGRKVRLNPFTGEPVQGGTVPSARDPEATGELASS